MSRKQIAVFIDHIGMYQQTILDGIRSVFEPLDIGTVVFVGAEIKPQEKYNTTANQVYELVKSENLDGLIIFSACMAGHISFPELETFVKKWKSKPLISLGVDIPNVLSLSVDNVSGMTEMVEHLIHVQGHKRFAYMQGFVDNIDSIERENVLRQVLERNNLELDSELIICGDFQSDSAFSAMSALLKKSNDFDVLVTANDRMADGALRAVAQHGLSTPDDIAVVGFDDEDESEFSTPPLTTVRQPTYELGVEAAKLILQAVNNELIEIKNSLASKLIIRESCGVNFKNELVEIEDISVVDNKTEEAQWNTILEYIGQLPNYTPELVGILEKYIFVKDTQTFLEEWKCFLKLQLIHRVNFQRLKEALNLMQFEIAPNFLSKNSLSKNQDEFYEKRYIQSNQILDRLYYESYELKHIKEKSDEAKQWDIRIKIMSMTTLQGLFEVLNQYLKNEVVRCFIVLYDHSTQTSTLDSNLYLAVKNGKILTNTPLPLKTTQLLPNEFLQELSGKMYLVPIFASNLNYGYMLIESEDHLLVTHDGIVQAIAVAIRNGLQLQTVQNHSIQLEKANDELTFLANYDSLTGLVNRFFLNKELKEFLVETAETNEKVAVIFLDLDGFKFVNDSLGHDIGDQLLIAVAKRLKNVVRNSDVVSRFGGDEFAIVLTNISDENAVLRVAENIISFVAEPFKIEGRSIFVTTSMGIAMSPKDDNQADTLMKYADLAMYQAKMDGKNCYQFYSTALNLKVLEKIKVGEELQKTMESNLNAFHLVYQPRYDLASNTMASVEALIRWQKEDGTYVSPAKFIPIAESLGLIHKIGDFVLRDACMQAKLWVDQGQPLPVSVNLSTKQLQDADIIEKIKQVLLEVGLEPQYLELEITESAAMTDVENNILKLQALRDMGIRIAIDDFGTAYSSLNYLKLLPISCLKIDQAFVRDIEDVNDTSNNTAIILAVIALGKSLGYRLVAEGVETEAQDQFLKMHDCDEVQGFLYSRPVSVPEINVLLDTEGYIELQQSYDDSRSHSFKISN